MKAVRPVIVSNGVPYLQMRSVGRTAGQEGKRNEGKGGHLSPSIVRVERALLLSLNNGAGHNKIITINIVDKTVV